MMPYLLRPRGYAFWALFVGCAVRPGVDGDGTAASTSTATGTATSTTATSTSDPTSGGTTTTGTTGTTSEPADSTTTGHVYIMPPDLGPNPGCECAADELCIYEMGHDSWWEICVIPPAGCDPAQKCSEACMLACVNPSPPIAMCDDDLEVGLVCLDGASACGPWAQNCPEGHKCAPIWDQVVPDWELECVPVPAPAPAVGEPCLGPKGSPTGVDDCAAGAMCWPVEGEGEKTCVAHCGGSPEAPQCGADQVCASLHHGTVTLCLQICDPLVQDCPMGQVCSPGLDGFVCVPDVSGPDGDLLDRCHDEDGCDAGFYCVEHAWEPSCQYSSCCVPFCDVGAPNCPGQASCVSPFTLVESEPPSGWDHVGVCVEP
ncbi:hypothetical protein [Nannocystis punicea]|uniref:Uncharacterized protein n=1 Tax=Nannocystis punicea TaxID=2995304 RepID=A0ABY7GXG1_9BACT|nr:hypothetical protein [Nannocystis poenicansa]WAS91565.1 hypothetical protein O0S08_35745 [Nannocystis poenicansa]